MPWARGIQHPRPGRHCSTHTTHAAQPDWAPSLQPLPAHPAPQAKALSQHLAVSLRSLWRPPWTSLKGAAPWTCPWFTSTATHLPATTQSCTRWAAHVRACAVCGLGLLEWPEALAGDEPELFSVGGAFALVHAVGGRGPHPQPNYRPSSRRCC